MGPAPRTAADHGRNALARGLAVLGDEWTMLIVQRAILGDRRYGEFRAALPISDAVLTARLGDLLALGLLDATTIGARRTYAPSARGRALWPVLLLVWDWERAWSVGPPTLPTMRHRPCGAQFAPELTCDHCHALVGSGTLRADWGPEGGWERSVPRGGRRRRGTARGPGQFPETMAVVGNHWSLAVLVAALWGTRRYGDFVATLGISPAVLSARLRDLAEGGLLTAHPGRVRADWFDYVPTPKAAALLPVFAVMVGWAERWFGVAGRPSVVLRHRPCGSDARLTVRCSRCRAILLGTDVVVGPLPESAH